MVKSKIQLIITDHLLKLRQGVSGSESDISLNVRDFLESNPQVRDLDITGTLESMRTESVIDTNLWTGQKKGKADVITSYVKRGPTITIVGSSTPKLEEYKKILLKLIGKGDLEIDRKNRRIYSSSQEISFSNTVTWQVALCLYENFGKAVSKEDIWDYIDKNKGFIETSSTLSEQTKKSQVYNAIGQINRRIERENINFFYIETERKNGYKMTRKN